MTWHLASIALAIGLAAVTSLAAKVEEDSDVKIGYRTQAYHGVEFWEALSDIKKLGYGGVEFCLDAPPAKSGEFDEDAARKFARMIADAGLEVYSVSHHGNFVSDDGFFAELKRLIPLARVMGTRTFVISSGPIDAKNRRRQRATVLKRLTELAHVAEKADVTLALEPEPGLAVESTRELIQLIWRIESSALRINLDIGHALLTDGDAAKSIRQAARLLVHAHIDDMSAGVHKHLIPGTGEIDLPAVMTAFLEIGFRGPFVVDLFNLDPAKAASPAMAEIKRALDVAQERIAAWPQISVSRFDLSKAFKSHHGTVYAMEPMPSGPHPPFQSAWGYLNPGEEMEMHYHPTEEIYLVFKGEGTVIVGPRERKVTAGDVVFIPPNQMHTMSNRSDRPLLWMAMWWQASKTER